MQEQIDRFHWQKRQRRRPVAVVEQDFERQYMFMWAMQKAECMLPMELTLMIMARITQDTYVCHICRKVAAATRFYCTFGVLAYCSEYCYNWHTRYRLDGSH